MSFVLILFLRFRSSGHGGRARHMAAMRQENDHVWLLKW